MGNKFDEPRGPFYNLFIFIIIIITISSLSLPFRFQSFGLNFTKFLDTNERHYIFLLCNGILFFLFLDKGPNQAGPEAKKIECNEISISSVDDQIEDLVLHEYVTEVKQIEQNGMLVGVDDLETEHVHDVDYEHEMVAICGVEDEEHDDEDEANEFRQKCEGFIKKVRQSMRYEGDFTW
ncbi:hypothetical protein L1987_19298 [Smallanthus sonchifolius]|uniref:Uncharacterized protein n=1 Tax=Smallanthus sonchifolius TaxID=185202 RepID=A0ACB9INX9_9ASTR|nr:hypothetical protein L1987_19298 [Smallanthus sonchifolius]